MGEDSDYWRTPLGVRRAYIAGCFGQVHYRVAGPGTAGRTPLVCFHPSPSSGRTYGALLREMGRDRYAIAPDTPGFGESDPPPSVPEIADYAAAIGDFLDALDIRLADILGHHTGSKIAVELARQRPEKVRSLVLISAPIYTDDELARQKAHYGRVEIEADGSHLQRRWQWMMQFRMASTPHTLVQRNIMESLRGGEIAGWGHRAAFNYHHRENLPRLTQPVLVLNPHDDLHDQTARAKDLLNDGRVHDLPGWSHGFLEMQAKETAAILRGFFDELERPVAPIRAINSGDRGAPAAGQTVRTFVDGAARQIHLRRAGPVDPAAPPLVMFHMSPNSGRVFEAMVEEMGRDRTAIAIDTPGFGESDAPARAPEIGDYAAAMAGIIKALGLGPVDVMGYHTGSMTAVELAHQYPSLVRRVIMISAPLYTPEEQAVRRARTKPEVYADDGSHLVERWRFGRTFYGEDVPLAVYARNYAEGGRGGPLAYWGHRAAFRHPLSERLAALGQSILVLRPHDDLVEQTARAADLLQNGRVQDMPGFTHGMLDTRTAEIAALLRSFLSPDT
jgi:pimeloyl-ACP methyl ester carboxylesterase